MGKSPGKWIKTVLFGKKTSKSSLARGKEPANGKEGHVRVVAAESGLYDNPPEAVLVDEPKTNSGYRETSFTQQDQEISESGERNADVEQRRELLMLTDTERIAQEKAATKTQAAFRGYLARRAFKALRGIIRLQALIRGHLVRRQAVATLYCVIGIVKLQALVRGSRIRCSDTGIEVQRLCIVKPLDGITSFHGDSASTSTANFSANAFIKKLLAPSPGGMPLRVQYDETDSNSVQIWLERWSISCPWKPVSPPKKATSSKIQKKHGNAQAVEGEIVRPKRSVRKVPSLFDNTSAQPTSDFEKPRRNSKKVPNHTSDSVQENPHSELEKVTSEFEKPRRNPKKVPSHSSDSVQENPQSELEKVKRSLRKVHTPVTESSTPSDIAQLPESQTQTSIVQDTVDPNEVNPVENIKEETVVVIKEVSIIATKETDQETGEAPVETHQPKEISNDDITKVESGSFEGGEKDENTPVPNGEVKVSEESVLSENQKSSRRASFSAKQEHIEDGLQNTPKVPSYMQATQSAKAKLRGQGSPRLSQDSAETNNVIRRHSLPSPANGKINSVSPRTPKTLQGSGKSGHKSDKSLLSSRDGNALAGKTTQGWRR